MSPISLRILLLPASCSSRVRVLDQDPLANLTQPCQKPGMVGQPMQYRQAQRGVEQLTRFGESI